MSFTNRVLSLLVSSFILLCFCQNSSWKNPKCLNVNVKLHSPFAFLLRKKLCICDRTRLVKNYHVRINDVAFGFPNHWSCKDIRHLLYLTCSKISDKYVDYEVTCLLLSAKAISVEMSGLWETRDKTFETWICPLVYVLIGYCDDIVLRYPLSSFILECLILVRFLGFLLLYFIDDLIQYMYIFPFRLCQDIVFLKAEVAELLLPNVFVNLAGRKDLDICKLISLKVFFFFNCCLIIYMILVVFLNCRI